MKINIIGCGPAGLYFAILMKLQNPAHEIQMVERDGPDDTFGWGIVFSDQTFSYLAERDRPSYADIVNSCQIWENVDIVHRGRKITVHGNRFSGIARIKFLQILRARCQELGVNLSFNHAVTDVAPYRDCDLLVGADGRNSIVRQTYEPYFVPSVDLRHNKYIWLGTRQLFHGLTLIFRENEAGAFAAHCYKFSDTHSTFIVECSEAVWHRAGLDALTEAETCRYLAKVFAEDLGGNELLSNKFVKWLNFPIIKNEHWTHENVVLLGDALHTAHFSIGSGTKMALEDAITLARCFEHAPEVGAALAAFENGHKPRIANYQAAAESSLLMFENMSEEMKLEPMPFAYKMMTRSKKVTYDKLKQRAPDFVAAYDEWSAENRKADEPS